MEDSACLSDAVTVRRIQRTVPVNYRDPLGLWRCNTETLCFEPLPDPGPGRHASPEPDPEPDPTGPDPDPPKRPECNNRTAVEFIKAHIDDASKLAKQLKVDVAFVLAVSEDESAFGGSNIAKNAKNYFGIWAGGANSTGVYVTTKGAKVSSYLGVADPYLASGQDFVEAEVGNAKAVGATTANQFFAAIHDKFGVGTADYVDKMVSIATMTALRISCN